MIVHANVSHSYDLLELPEGVPVTEEDKLSKRVIPSANGGWRARALKKGDTFVVMQITEATIVQKIIQKYAENMRCGKILTRHEAATAIMEENLMAGHFHSKHVQSFEAHDDGPSRELFLSALAPHLDADHGYAIGMKNIDKEDVDALVDAYMMKEPEEVHPDSPTKAMRSPVAPEHSKRRADALVAHLHSYFKVKPATAAKGV